MFFERHTFGDSELPIFFEDQYRNLKEPKFELHWHESAEFIYIINGAVEINIGDSASCFFAGDMIFIDPQVAHSFRAVNGTAEYHCLIPDNSILIANGINPGDIHTENVITDTRIKELFLDAVKEYREKKDGYKSCIRGDITLMLSLILREYRVNESAETESSGRNAMKIAKSAIDYIDKHYAEKIGGEEISEYLGISRFYLSHVMKEVTKQTLTENLSYIRCRKARDLLRGGMNVGEVAFRTGFGSGAHFCRTYEKMMGVPPSRHRKNGV